MQELLIGLPNYAIIDSLPEQVVYAIQLA